MKKSLILFFTVITATISFAQDNFYLIDTTNFHQLVHRERILLDSLLPEYHKLNTDSDQVRFIFNMYSKMNDNDVWIEYLKLMNKILEKHKNDPDYKKFYLKYKSKYYNDYGYYYDYIGLNDSTWVYYEKSYQMNLKLQDTSLIALSLNNLAMQYKFRGKIDKAIEMNKKAIEMLINSEFKDQLGLAYNNLGAIYHNQSRYEISLDYYIKAYKIFQKSGNLKGAGLAANNIGSIYQDTGDMKNSLDYYNKALEIHLKRGDKNDISKILFKIGNYYMQLHDFKKALSKFLKAYNISKESGSVRTISLSMSYAGDAYKWLNNNDSAKYYFERALSIAKSSNNRSDMVSPMRQLSEIYLNEGNIDQAYQYAKEAMNMADEFDYPIVIARCAKILSKIYAKKKNWQKAYEMHCVFSEKWEYVSQKEQKKETIRKEFQYEFDKKEALKEAEHQKELEIAEAQRIQQKIISFAIAAGLLLSIIFAFIIWKRLKVTRNQKKIIETQKQIVDAKNREIIDSINYAQLIQAAFLQQEDYINEKFPPHFIYFKPKDIVSGDFYWGLEKNGYTYIAVADCTGHGVPGAMMSMLGIAFLNEISVSDELLKPNQIFEKLRGKLITELNKKGKKTDTKDGMDISMILLNKERTELNWSGANIPLYIVRKNKELIFIKGDKQPVGNYPDISPFTNHYVKLLPDDEIFLFSDGYPDQFGGEHGKKFKYNRFKSLLIDITKFDVGTQKDMIDKTLKDWMTYKNPDTGNSYDQIDDITVMGIKISDFHCIS